MRKNQTCRSIVATSDVFRGAIDHALILRRSLVGLAVSSLAVATLGCKADPAASPQRRANPQLPTHVIDPNIALARDTLLSALRDPNSAQFRDVVIGRRRPKELVIGNFEQPDVPRTMLCGYVNSRNAMGGYAGFTQFFVMLPEEHEKIDAVVDIASNSEILHERIIATMIEGYCGQAALTDNVDLMTGEHITTNKNPTKILVNQHVL